MEKYFVFRKLLDFVADHAEVNDADMNNYRGDIVITGEDDENVIKIEVSIKNKEEKQND